MTDFKLFIWLGLALLLFPANNDGEDCTASSCKEKFKDDKDAQEVGVGCATKAPGDSQCVACNMTKDLEKQGYSISGCISIILIVISVILGILFWCAVAFIICWCVAACPLYKWRMRRRGGRGGGGANRAASSRNVPSKASQRPGTKPPTPSSSRATKN